MNETDLQAKGYVQAPDGSWHKPKRGNLGGLGIPERERDPVQALDRGDEARQNRTSRVAIRVEIVSFRKRVLDDDNSEAGNKPLRDAIARSLGIDDGDPCFSWEYAQHITKGRPGTLVKIALTE